MAPRRHAFAPGCYYHVCNRGTNREDLFRSKENYLYLLRLVKQSAQRHDVAVIVYCLMPNHYHFLVRQNSSHTISCFIQAIFNAYTKAFNAACRRSGTLFEGPFKSVSVENSAYLLHLCRYIHRNPVEAGLVEHPAGWAYSNYPEWAGLRQGSLVDRAFVAQHFPDPVEYERFVMEYVPPEKTRRGLERYLLEN